MKLTFVRSILFSFALLSMASAVSAQCLYRLDMVDSFGDGWNGGVLTINNGALSYEFTLDNFTDDGLDSTVYFSVQPGTAITLDWLGGAFLGEISMTLYDSEDNQLFTISNPPIEGVLFTGVTACPPCAQPQNVVIENIWDKRIRIKWSPGVATLPSVGWWVIYGPEGFVPGPNVGDTLYVTTPKATVTGLTPKTKYTFYVRQNCGTDISGLVGPFDFETYWTNDVGVSAVVTPQSDCELGTEVIRFNMKNSGANPLSLIPYNFYINGEPGGVGQPEDGYYTGVIGKDSTELIEFETTFDFSEPGEYEIMVFTQLEGDDDTSNDTLRWYINNVLTAPYSQTFERWNGGWVTTTAPFSFNPSTWEWGVPNGLVIKAAGEGKKAWVTNLDGPHLFLEGSYITSTCFDFSELNADPVVEFLLNTDLDAQSGDGTFLEVSIDSGTSWDRIGVQNEGINWYNGLDQNTGEPTVWTDKTNGWVKTHHRLNGVAGEDNVLLRFGLDAGFTENEGIGIDDLQVFFPVSKDVETAIVTTAGEPIACGLESDTISVTVVNVGQQVVPAVFTLAYSVNGGTPVIENVNAGGTLTPDENFTYTFNTTFDSRNITSNIQVWAVVAGDLNILNDTLNYIFSHEPRVTPFREDFEGLIEPPSDWNISFTGFTGPSVTDQHNNISNVLAINMYASSDSFEYELPVYGPIKTGDSLAFDYRITNFFDGTVPTVLNLGATYITQISTDCGLTYTNVNSINALNHTPTVQLRTRKIGLENYLDQDIRIKFVGTWSTLGDYWFDLDNIRILSCAADMLLSANVTGASPNLSNGSATLVVGLGNPPYKYIWSNGATTATATGLAIGSYTVTVTDAHGCSQSLDVNVGTSGTNDGLNTLQSISLRPNPTTGLLFLDLTFDQQVDLHAEMVNALGQRVWINSPGETTTLSTIIDLNTQPTGIYFLRIIANGQVLTKKVMKN